MWMLSIGQYHYLLVQWLFFFYFYCCFGWVFESTYVSLKEKRLVNRGFMRGPFLPLYGTGAIMMLIVSAPFQENLILVYISGCIGATVLEYITGVTMEALFKVRYWDYSDKRFNFQGHICLGSSLAWGFLTILMTQFVHKPFERLVLGIPLKVLLPAVAVLTLYLAIDFALSFKAAMDIRDILSKMERAKEELERVSKRLDVLIALANEGREIRKQEREEKREDLKGGFKWNLEERFDSLKDAILEKPSAYLDSVKDEFMDLREKYHMNVELTKQLKSFKDYYKKAMLRGNPTMVSGKFKEALEELKDTVSGRKNEE